MRQIRRFSHSGTTESAPAPYEAAHAAVARAAAAEGIVLLKNQGFLPLSPEAPIALLGGGAVYTVKGGTGSGDVNERERVSIWQGLKASGQPIVTDAWLRDYAERYTAARESWKQRILGEDAGTDVTEVFNNYARQTFRYPDGAALTEDTVAGAVAAVYVVSRVAGEGADRKPEKGDYYLTDKELEDLRFLDRQKLPTVLILNAGGPKPETERCP